MNRTVLLVVLLLVVIVGGGVAYLFLSPPGGPGGEETADPNRPTSTDVRPFETAAPSATAIPMVPVVIAIQDIPRGTVVNPDSVAVVLFPAENAPSSAFTTLESVTGLIAATNIYREEIILARKLVQDLNSISSSGSEAAAILDPQRVAIAVPIDEITSVAYGLRPGDRIDVIVSMLFVDVDEDFQTLLPNDFRILMFASDEFGNTTLTWSEVAYGDVSSESFYTPNFETGAEANEQNIEGSTNLQYSIVEEPNPLDGRRQRPRLVTQRTVTDAQVIWVGEFPQDPTVSIFSPVVATPTQVATPTVEGAAEGEPTSAATPEPVRPQLITLGVTVQDAVTLSWLSEAGLPMTFVMRSARSQGLPDTQAVTMSYIMSAYNIEVPPKFSFSLEPAIRGVRGITLLDTGQQREAIVAEDNAEGDTSTADSAGSESSAESGE